MSIPITLYSPDGERSREIAAIDAPGWIRAGWSTTPIEKQPIPAIPATPATEVETQTKSKKNDVSRECLPAN